MRSCAIPCNSSVCFQQHESQVYVYFYHGHNWTGPCKPAWCENFVAIFQVAQNSLKFAMSTFFVLKMSVFFSTTQKNMDKTVWKSPHLPVSVSKQPRISILESQIIVRVCFTLLEEEGVDFQECVWSLVSPLVPKIQDIFSQKKSRHGKFQRILNNLENRYKIVTWGRLAQTLSIVSENQTKLLLLLHRVYN